MKFDRDHIIGVGIALLISAFMAVGGDEPKEIHIELSLFFFKAGIVFLSIAVSMKKE